MLESPFVDGYALEGRLIENAAQGDSSLGCNFSAINLSYKLMIIWKLHGTCLKNSQYLCSSRIARKLSTRNL